MKVVPSERVTLIWPWELMAKEARWLRGRGGGRPVASILMEPSVDNPASWSPLDLLAAGGDEDSRFGFDGKSAVLGDVLVPLASGP